MNKNTTKKDCLNSETVLQFDQFGSPMLFNFANGSTTYRSSIGSCFNVAIFVLTFGFMTQQINVLLSRRDTMFTTSIEYGYFEPEYELRRSDDFNFMLAFAVVDVRGVDFVDYLGRQEEEIF